MTLVAIALAALVALVPLAAVIGWHLSRVSQDYPPAEDVRVLNDTEVRHPTTTSARRT